MSEGGCIKAINHIANHTRKSFLEDASVSATFASQSPL